MNSWVTIESESGQRWALGRRVVYESYAAYYQEKDGDDWDTEVDDETLVDWLKNNMDWKEIQEELMPLPRAKDSDPAKEWPNMTITVNE